MEPIIRYVLEGDDGHADVWLLEIEATQNIVTLLSHIPPLMREGAVRYLFGGYMLVADRMENLNRLDGVTVRPVVAITPEEELAGLSGQGPEAVVTASGEDGTITAYRLAQS